ncbi:MAG: ABC transporter permease [Acutalibacteraceae bacterium]
MNKNKKTSSPLLKSDAGKSIISSLMSILIGLIVGSIIVLIVAATDSDIGLKGGIEGVKLILFGIFSKGRDSVGNLVFGFNGVNIGNLLFRATPIIMTGLSVAIAFKTGLFNIGAPGQFLMGTAFSLIIALSIPTETVPAFVVWILAFLGGMSAGAVWGAIPGFLKAQLHINEVLACIMTNWIAANIVTWIFESSPLRNAQESGKIGYIMPTSANGVVTAKMGLDKIFPGSQANGGIVVAIIIAVIVYILISKTTLGYELKACGSNSHAANYAGIKGKRNIVLSMAIAGALSGGAAALYYLSGNTEFFWSTYQSLPSEGFNGIPVALLASNNPIGVIFAGCFMSALNIAGQQLKTLTPYNEHLTNIIIAAIVYLSAFSLIIKQFLSKRKIQAVPTVKTDAAGEILQEAHEASDTSKEKEENE